MTNDKSWQRERRIIEVLSSLNYRTGELNSYLHNIACGVSELIGVDWTVVTYCQEGFETILASSIEMAEDAPRVYALHGRLIGTVMEIKRSLAVDDAIAHPEYGKPAPGYRAYLGIPLQTVEGQVFGTVCSFHRQTREFTSDEIQIVELFAERAATAIDHYHLYQQQCQFNQILEDEVCINVHNSGNSIPPEVLYKLCQPFLSTKPDGTGLGPAITKRIVNAHGGKLSIQSQALTGTIVSVQLPVVNDN
jgi:transcriptional regulator with GAF, ATPase, and Fis domain